MEIGSYNQFISEKLNSKTKQCYEWSKSNLTDWKIKWNVKGISGDNNNAGYIVQKMHLKNDFPLIHIVNTDYYEAWKVENGTVKNNGIGYDDNWGTFCLDLIDREEIKRIDNLSKGITEYSAEVY